MKVLVNAVGCRVAGGRSVALNFLRCYRESDFPHELIVYAPAGVGYEELTSGRIRIEVAPPVVHKGFARPWVDNVWSRRIEAEHRPDLLFAMGNIAYPTSIPQVVLFQWAYAIYPEGEVWESMPIADSVNRRVRRWLFGRRARFATCFAAQTETARERLARVWGIENVVVVPNAVSIPEPNARASSSRLPNAVVSSGRHALLCLARYYPHKNLEILLEVARRVRDADLPFVILTTVSPADGRAARAFVEAIRRDGLAAVLVNLGTIAAEEVPSIYGASSGLLLPTLLESFSGTYVESMFYGKPVFTSDRDFARDVCGDTAWYFDPHDAGSILDTIRQAFDDPREMSRRLDAARERCAGFPDWREVTEKYVHLFERVVRAP